MKTNHTPNAIRLSACLLIAMVAATIATYGGMDCNPLPTPPTNPAERGSREEHFSSRILLPMTAFGQSTAGTQAAGRTNHALVATPPKPAASAAATSAVMIPTPKPTALATAKTQSR